MSEEMTMKEARHQARKLLESAGVAEAQITELLADDASVRNVLDGGMVFASTVAGRFPSEGKSLYGQYGATFSGSNIPQGASPFSYIPEDNTKDYVRNADGVVRYSNGVMYDPDSDQIVFNHADAGAQGSMAWFEAAQEEWSDQKIETWRKRLNDHGYKIAEKGKFDVTFKSALQDFFTNKYKNLGKPLPLDSPHSETEWGGALDPAVLNNEVRGWYETAFGDNPTDAELNFWTDKLTRSAKRIAEKKGLDPTQAGMVAQARVQEKFRTSDDVVAQQEVDQDLEENTGLRDKFISLAQIAGM